MRRPIECSECGAAVLNVANHETWHRAQLVAAQLNASYTMLLMSEPGTEFFTQAVQQLQEGITAAGDLANRATGGLTTLQQWLAGPPFNLDALQAKAARAR